MKSCKEIKNSQIRGKHALEQWLLPSYTIEPQNPKYHFDPIDFSKS